MITPEYLIPYHTLVLGHFVKEGDENRSAESSYVPNADPTNCESDSDIENNYTRCLISNANPSSIPWLILTTNLMRISKTMLL